MMICVKLSQTTLFFNFMIIFLIIFLRTQWKILINLLILHVLSFSHILMQFLSPLNQLSVIIIFLFILYILLLTLLFLFKLVVLCIHILSLLGQQLSLAYHRLRLLLLL